LPIMGAAAAFGILAVAHCLMRGRNASRQKPATPRLQQFKANSRHKAQMDKCMSCAAERGPQSPACDPSSHCVGSGAGVTEDALEAQLQSTAHDHACEHRLIGANAATEACLTPPCTPGTSLASLCTEVSGSSGGTSSDPWPHDSPAGNAALWRGPSQEQGSSAPPRAQQAGAQQEGATEISEKLGESGVLSRDVAEHPAGHPQGRGDSHAMAPAVVEATPGGAPRPSRHTDGSCRWATLRLAHGIGSATAPDGSSYAGEFKEGKMNGKGTYVYSDGSIYNGEWRDDKPHGRGTFKYVNGDMYDGLYEGGRRQGAGTFWFADGEVEIGSYRDDADFGEGVRWSTNRKRAWILKDGVLGRQVPIKETYAIAARIGLPQPQALVGSHPQIGVSPASGARAPSPVRGARSFRPRGTENYGEREVSQRARSVSPVRVARVECRSSCKEVPAGVRMVQGNPAPPLVSPGRSRRRSEYSAYVIL